jgi:hypothetical protein
MDGSASVWILGGYQSDFARNLTREGRDFAALTAEVVDGMLAAAGVDATNIGVVHVGNAFGEMFAGQGHLGAMPATVCDELWGTPAARTGHEGAGVRYLWPPMFAQIAEGYKVHDCFRPSEYLAVDHIRPGRPGRIVEGHRNGSTANTVSRVVGTTEDAWHGC